MTQHVGMTPKRTGSADDSNGVAKGVELAAPTVEGGLGSDRPLSVAQAYRVLRVAQKGNRGAPAYSRWVNRPFGRVLAAGAYGLRMTPNRVTATSALFTYVGIAVIAVLAPSHVTSLLVAGLLLIGYALDSADGQLARLTGLGRSSGEWLDHVVDMGKICLLHGAVAMSWLQWNTTGRDLGPWRAGVPLGFLAIGVVSFFAWLLSDLLIRLNKEWARAEVGPAVAAPSSVPSAHAPAPVLRSLLRSPSDYGFLALSFAWFATPFFLWTYLALLAANGLILLLALPTWYSQVRRAESA